jgi:hypothetical protein
VQVRAHAVGPQTIGQRNEQSIPLVFSAKGSKLVTAISMPNEK